MKTFLIPFLAGLVWGLPSAASAQTYILQLYTPPPGSTLVQADYAALSGHALLVHGIDANLEPLAAIVAGNHETVFRVGAPMQEYSWYRGVNDRGTTVGFKEVLGTPDMQGWLRTRSGQVSLFGSPGERTFLYRVNESNVAVGETTLGGGAAWSAYIVDAQGGHTVAVPGVSPALNTYFAAINDQNAILGGSWSATEHHPFLLHNGVVTYFDVPGAHEVGLRALNNKGQAAGYWTAFDPTVGDYVSHGFIRDRNGLVRTIDVPFGFQTHVDYDPAFFGGYPVIAASGDLLAQGTAILDLDDDGRAVFELSAWYLITLIVDGTGPVQFVSPAWVYALGTP